MSFQTPITIRAALESIQRQEFVLPAIQREFVWRPDQIARLFDSLLQGYPIGSFLFWNIRAEHTSEYTWYGFIKDYHQLKSRHCPELNVPTHAIKAILDGQQRLTSLNIGLRGSHAEKEPRKWWNNPDAFPTKYLFLNLCGFAPENEFGLRYDFRFLTAQRAAEESKDGQYWFRVGDVLGFKSGKDVHKRLQQAKLGQHEHAYDILYQLYDVVHEKQLIPYFVEEEPNLDKVLNIFIRVNSGGTPLSYSDLLLSIATSEWKERDARRAIHEFVDDLNRTRHGFQISKDLVLKAGLMLSDRDSVAFRVTNFNAANMRALDEHWDGIEKAVRVAVGLMADFGFSAQNLTADSVIIPIAYYVHKRGLDDRYRTAPGQKADRERMRGWVCRSLVKAGVWGSGLDTLLLALRDALREPDMEAFPVDALESAMAKRGKGLRFSEDELLDLVDSGFGEKRTFALLSLMYSHVDLRNVFHVDHVFPVARFAPSRLRRAGIGEEDIERFTDSYNRLGNLQLLDGAANIAKQDKLPAEWLQASFPKKAARSDFCDRNDLGEVPEKLDRFGEFYAARRQRMLDRLRGILQVEKQATIQVASG